MKFALVLTAGILFLGSALVTGCAASSAADEDMQPGLEADLMASPEDSTGGCPSGYVDDGWGGCMLNTSGGSDTGPKHLVSGGSCVGHPCSSCAAGKIACCQDSGYPTGVCTTSQCTQGLSLCRATCCN